MTNATLFEELYRRHHAAMLRFVERRVADRETAQDVCAECFLIAWRRLDVARPFGAAWLYATARNLVGEVYRRVERDRRLVTHLAGDARANAAALSPVDGDMAVHRAPAEYGVLAAIVASLPPDDRDALVLTYWHGLSAAEASRRAVCSEQAMWKRVSRARRTVRDRWPGSVG